MYICVCVYICTLETTQLCTIFSKFCIVSRLFARERRDQNYGQLLVIEKYEWFIILQRNTSNVRYS